MKRQKALELNQSNDFNKKLGVTMQPDQKKSQIKTEPSLNETVDPRELQAKLKTLTHLASNKPYSKEDIVMVAEYLASKHGYQFDTQVKVIDKFEDFKLSEQVETVSLKKTPIFVICNRGKNHWVTFCVLEHQNFTLLLYKDSLGKYEHDRLRTAIRKSMDGPLGLKLHEEAEQVEENNCGPMSLRNMDIIMRGLKSDQDAFIKLFKKQKFCNDEDVERVRKRFVANLLNKCIIQTVTSITLELSKDQAFTKDLQVFIDYNLKYIGAADEVKNYTNLLQEELEKQQHDPNYKLDEAAITKAKRNFFNNDEVWNLIKKHDITDETKPDDILKVNIQEKYPEQMEKLTNMFDLLTKTKKGDKLEKALELVCDKLDVDGNKLKKFFGAQILSEIKKEKKSEERFIPKNLDDITKNLPVINKKIIKNEVNVKSLEQLLCEIASESSVDEDFSLMEEERKDCYRKKYAEREDILQLEKNYHEIKKIHKSWTSRSMSDILDWTNGKKRKLQGEDLLEAIAVMDRANEIATGGCLLRDSQILSLLIFLQSNKNHGKICQIHTGEGKTTIVSLLAAVKVLQGEKVDVITSNPILAEEGVKNRENFYGILGISATTNNQQGEGCGWIYTADIVYGSMGGFQFDYLKETFEGQRTRNQRPFECVILDEVDSLLIDNGGHIAKLAGPFPGIDSLKYVHVKIWQELTKAENNLYPEFEKKLNEKSEEIAEQPSACPEEIQTSMSELFDGLMNDIKTAIKKSNPADIELIPAHLKQYATSMVDEWINNAIYAKYHSKLNEQYIIRQKNGEDVIVPVDYQNTGVTLKNTIWSNGLHQFLQLKHNLQLTSETLTSSFISNIGYIKLYNNNIYGLTGTLGSKAEQDLLSVAYDVSYAKIPTYKQRNFQELDGIVVRDNHWVNMVTLFSIAVAGNGRSVLIICKTIKDLTDIEKNLRGLAGLEKKIKGLKIKTYADESGSRIVDSEVGTGEIIIATNIAGRGTDFKTSAELEDNGGLHICVSFLPVNQRVEDQAFGRTARQGNFGTAQLILRETEVLDLELEIVPEMTFCDIKKKRDELEKIRLENVEKTDLLQINFQDGIFGKFSELYRQFKRRQVQDPADSFLVRDLKEFWAFWLQQKRTKGEDLTKADVEEEFKSFERDASKILGGKISQNPYYSIAQAEHYLNVKKRNEAEAAVTHAINLSKGNTDLLYSAHIKLFEIAMDKGAPLKERLKKALAQIIFIPVEKDESYKQKAKDALIEAENALQEEIDYLQTNFIGETDPKTEKSTNEDYQNILLPSEKANLLQKHIVSRLVVLDFFHQHVESLKTQISESIKANKAGLAICARNTKYFKELNEKKPNEKSLLDATTNEEISELALVGLEAVYAMREVHDVDDRVLNRARLQISAGISAVAMGAVFPPVAPMTGAIAGTLVSEGVCDIVMDLITAGAIEFNEEAYIKGKCISYGIALVTMGISALLNSVNMLEKAIDACRGLASMLRKCTVLRSVCEKLAAQLEKLAVYLEKLKYLAEFNNMSKIAQAQFLEKLKVSADLQKFKELGLLNKFAKLHLLKEITPAKMQAFTCGLKAVGTQTMKNVVGSIVAEKIVTAGCEKIVSCLKPKIDEKVREIVDEEFRNDKRIKSVTPVDVQAIINRLTTLTTAEQAWDVLKEIAYGHLKQTNNWKMKVALTAVDTAQVIESARTYARLFCRKIKEELTAKEKQEIKSDYSYEIKDVIATHVTEKIHGLLVQLAGKYANTFVVNPAMNKLWSVLGSGQNDGPSEEEEQMKTFNDILEAYSDLGLQPGASEEEILEAFKNETNNKVDAKRANEAFAFLIEMHKSTKQNLEWFSVNQEGDKVHKGNVITLSNRLKRHIVIKKLKDNGEIEILEFGTEFKENGEPIRMDYYNDHFSLPSELFSTMTVTSTGENNCFFDVITAQLNKEGDVTTASELRQMAEQFSMHNLVYGTLNHLSDLLNNPLTMSLFLRSKDALLVGGREYRYESKPMTDDVYPSTKKLPIKNDKKLEKPLEKFQKKLDEAYDKAKNFDEKNLTVEQNMKRAGETYPVFEKEKMMLGIMEADVEDERGRQDTIKIMTVSGTEPFCVRKKLVSSETEPGNRFADDIKQEPIPWNLNIDGYKFVDPGQVSDKNIYDLQSGEIRDEKYSSDCAAQKLMYYIGNEMRKNGYKIKQLKMKETYYKRTRPSRIITEQSCKRCEKTLPQVTGGKPPREPPA